MSSGYVFRMSTVIYPADSFPQILGSSDNATVDYVQSLGMSLVAMKHDC